MAYNVKFLQGLQEAYNAISSKDANTFYYTTDKNNLYLGEVKLSNAADFAAADKILDGRITENTNALTTLTGGVGVSGSVDQKINAAIEAIKAGDIEIIAQNGVTGANVQAALENLAKAIKTGGTGSVVAVSKTSTSPLQYTVTQGGEPVGTIDIPKDMVVESGKVVENPLVDGQTKPGTFIELKLANVTKPIYIDVAKLIDNYTAAPQNTQIKVVVDAETRQISATFVAGGVGTAELAEGAVTETKLGASAVTNAKLAANAVKTANILDGNVTKAKLESGVQTSLGKADTALQKANITEGTGNGTIAVGGTDVKVHGLGSAAYVPTSTFETPVGAQEKATTALTSAKSYADGLAKNYDKVGAAAAVLGDSSKDTTESNTVHGVKKAAAAAQAKANANATAITKKADKEAFDNHVNAYNLHVKAYDAHVLAQGEKDKAQDTKIAALEAADITLQSNIDAANSKVNTEIGKLNANVTSKANTGLTVNVVESAGKVTGVTVGGSLTIGSKTVSSEAPAANQGLQVSVSTQNGQVSGVTVTGDFDKKYDALNAASTALTDAKSYADTKASAAQVAAEKTAAADATLKADGAKVAAIEAAKADAKSKADTAETNAKAYVDAALTWGSFPAKQA